MRIPLWAVGLLAAATLRATTFYVTVAGLGGEPDYEQRFASQAQEIDKLLHGSSSDVKVTTLYGPQATKGNVQNALAQVTHEVIGCAFDRTALLSRCHCGRSAHFTPELASDA